jgi:hypothetical protein
MAVAPRFICPSCSKRDLTASIFGSICGSCFYQGTDDETRKMLGGEEIAEPNAPHPAQEK